MGRQAIRHGATKPGPTVAVATVNARGVFAGTSRDDRGDDEATLMYQPQRRPNNVRSASHFPLAPRLPVIQLESVPALPPSQLVVAESTPAVTFDAESGEYARVPTMPVPRMSVAPRAHRLPYFAAGVLALAAGALVVLLAGVGKKSAPFPTAWQTGTAAASAQTAQPATARPTPVAQSVNASHAPARSVAERKAHAQPPVPAAPKIAAASRPLAPRTEKAAKPSKPSKGDVGLSKSTADIATGLLHDSP